ncbi:DNA gyrase subunit B [Patescibacteria group bacterium]|nr:DNA gyrase subunit B [Patescibacteria group bacterium]
MPKSKKIKIESNYTAKDIYVLEGLEPVRKRPAMYIGSTGPEGLHHLLIETVANSLTFDTPIIIRNEGKIQIEKIGNLLNECFEKNSQFIEKSENAAIEILRKGFQIETISFNPFSLKLSFQPVFSLIRHKVNSEIYRITLQNNREIEITPYHSLFTLKEGKILPIEGKEIKIGTPIAVPKNWPEPENCPKEIDLIDEFLKLPEDLTKKINLYNLTQLFREDKNLAEEIKKKISIKNKSRNGRLRYRASIWQDYLGYNYLPFNLIRGLSPAHLEKIKSVNCQIGNRRNDSWKIDYRFKIDKNLIEILGLFAAEGTIKRDYRRILFSFGAAEKELMKYVCCLIQKTFGIKVKPRYAHETAKVIELNSSLLALIFKEIIKTGENSANKNVPDLIFNLSKKLRERYLMGYLAGDGYPSAFFTLHLIENTTPSITERKKFVLVTKSKNLASKISYLLSSLNKTYSFGKRKKREKEKRFIIVNYKGKETKREIKSSNFSYVIDFYWNTNSSYINYYPSNEVISNFDWRKVYPLCINFKGGISKEKVITLLEREAIKIFPAFSNFFDSDLGILRVKKIKKISYNYPYVYDVSVPGGENFVAGFSPIIAHNSIDEAIMGYCAEIKVIILPENRIQVEDNGRGIPVDIHPKTKKSALETVMTTLHAGAKFGGKVYVSTGGLHGVGISAVCALSTYMRAEVCRDGIRYVQEYVRGKPKAGVKKIGKCKQSGTSVLFEPDPEIFKEIKFELKKIINHLRQQAYLTKGLKIIFNDQTKKPAVFYAFYFEGGLPSYVRYLTQGIIPRHQNIFYGSGEKSAIIVEIALRYTDEYECYEESFVNNVRTSDGGTHLTGFRTALTKTFNDYARKNEFLKAADENLSGEDIREGLTAVVSIKIREPQFEGQTKAKLGNSEAKTAVEQVVSETLTDFLERNPQDSRAIIEKCVLSQKARKAAKAAKETVLRKGILNGLALPGKLADCSSRKPEESEIYIVEGESAGGSSRQARDRHFQAILPLRGKILNIERARLDKILASKEIKSLIIALGTAIAEDFNLDKLRYHRIILMADADSDGNHIRTLLLTLFFRYFKPIIEKGYLYIAQPPLYKIQSGKEIKYVYTEDEKLVVLKSLKNKFLFPNSPNSEIKKIFGASIQRYKGLGEMNPSELWETTMSPENRILLQVKIEDVKEADRTFDILMGDEVLPRKKFIQAWAKKVKNLDI